MGGDDLHLPLHERVRLLRCLEVELPEANQKLLWLDAGGKRERRGWSVDTTLLDGVLKEKFVDASGRKRREEEAKEERC